MTNTTVAKKRIVTSYKSLAPEIQDELKLKYPYGFADVMMRIDKPNGDFMYAVPYETDQIAYLIKIDVKIDENPSEDDDKYLFDEDEIKGAEELEDDNSDDDN